MASKAPPRLLLKPVAGVLLGEGTPLQTGHPASEAAS